MKTPLLLLLTLASLVSHAALPPITYLEATNNLPELRKFVNTNFTVVRTAIADLQSLPVPTNGVNGRDGTNGLNGLNGTNAVTSRTNILAGASWTLDAGWQSNGNGSFTCTNLNGYAAMITALPRRPGPFFIIYEYAAFTSGNTQSYFGSNGDGAAADSAMAGATPAAGRCRLGIIQAATNATQFLIRAQAGFVGTISNIVLIPVN